MIIPVVFQAEIAAAEAEVAKANYSNPLGQIMFGGAVNTMAVDKSLLGEVKQEEELPQVWPLTQFLFCFLFVKTH